MKRLYYLIYLLAFSLTFTSCNDEPLEGEFAESDNGMLSSCEDASAIFGENALALQNATPENFELVCTNYNIALQGILDSCSDELDADFITSIELALAITGDCSMNSSACAEAREVSAIAALDFESASDEDIDAFCEIYEAALLAEIMACGDDNGILLQLLNSLPCTACGQAGINADQAEIAFNESDPTNVAEFEAICGLYSMALQTEIAECGDPDGSLMAIVLELGDCTPPEEDGPIRLVLDGEIKNFNTANVTINGSLLSVDATDLDTGDTFTFDIVLQQTGTNVAQSIELTVNGVVHTPFMSGDTPFISIITENTGMVIRGSFTGSMINPSGEFVTTEDGIIDVTF